MNRNELEERYHNAMDITFNLLQQLVLLTQQMTRRLDTSDCPVTTRQQLLESLGQIESTEADIRVELHSFSSTMETFLTTLDTGSADAE